MTEQPAGHGRGFIVALVLATAALALPKLALYLDYSPSFDDVYYSGWALDAIDEPRLLLAPDYAGRPHPLLIAVLAVCRFAFGPAAWPIGLLLLGAHVGSALAVGRLAVRLGTGPAGEATAACGFLLFASANAVFAQVVYVGAAFCCLLAVLALHALARHLTTGGTGWAVAYAACYVGSLGFFEYGAMTPVIGLGLAAALPAAPHRRCVAVHIPPLSLLLVAGLGAALGEAGASYGLGIGGETALKLLALPRELIQGLLVPHADLVGSTAIRLLAAALMVALIAISTRPSWGPMLRALGSRPALFGVGFTVVAAAPFLLRPTGAVWHSRYLYLPGIGVALLLATIVGAAVPGLCRARRRLLVVAAIVVLSLNALTLHHLADKRQRDWVGVAATERRSSTFELARRLRRLAVPEGSRVLVLGSPLREGEIQRTCRRYVRSQPSCSGRPTSSVFDEAVLVLDWHAD